VESGEVSWNGRCLHEINEGTAQEDRQQSERNFNLYQQVISTLANVLVRRFDDDGVVPMLGFGNTHVFSMTENARPCMTKQDMLDCYETYRA
jgi:hypothetical protein